ncbi:MAG: vWA domain-containing protein [Bacteroidota bacterium]|nr:vWA domain-containing protein [Bacteroidota bacterium]
MENNYLKIIFVIDESGSMAGSERDVIGGFNNFIEKQKREDYGKIDVSLYKFNDQVNRVVNNQPASEVRTLTLKDYNPSSFTALYDAVGKAIHDTDKQIALIPEAERPNKVMTVIITDGEENASTEYSGKAIRSLISSREELMGWNFIFLGSGLDNFVDADVMGARYRARTSKKQFTAAMERVSDSSLLFRIAGKKDEKTVLENLMSDLNKLDDE